MADYSQMRRMAALSPEEEAASAAYETSPATRMQLEEAMRAESDPAKRAVLGQLYAQDFQGAAPSGAAAPRLSMSEFLAGQTAPNPGGPAAVPGSRVSMLDFLANVQVPPAPPPPSGMIRRVAGDGGLSLLKGAIGVPEAIVGLADIATGGRAGKMAEEAGFRPKEAKGMLDEFMTPEQKQANENVQKAQGVVDTTVAAFQNPSVVLHSIAESLPSMLGGGVVGRAVMKMAPAVTRAVAAGVGVGEGAVAAGVGEGVVSAGQSAEQIRQETTDGLLTPQQAALAGGSGVLTGLLGVVAGKVAGRMGVHDVDILATGKGEPVVQKSFTKQVLLGALSEGILEELPQSVQEQVAQNLALGKPIDEGVAQAAVLGALAGGVMGAGAQALGGHQKTAGDEVRDTKVPEAGPLTRAANAGIEVEAKALDATAGRALPKEPLAPDAAKALLDMANERAAELETKAKGTKDEKKGGKTIAGTPAQFLTPEEKAELEFLKEHGGDVAQLEARYGKPMTLAGETTPSDALPFEANRRFEGAPVFPNGKAPAAQTYGTKQAADIAIGEQGLMGSHQAVETAPNTFQIRPIGTQASVVQPGIYETTEASSAVVPPMQRPQPAAAAAPAAQPPVAAPAPARAVASGKDASAAPNTYAAHGMRLSPEEAIGFMESQAARDAADAKASGYIAAKRAKNAAKLLATAPVQASEPPPGETPVPSVVRGGDAGPFKSRKVAERRAAKIQGATVEQTDVGFVLRVPLTAKAAAAETRAEMPKDGATLNTLTGDKINRKWTAFAPDSGTLNVPRAEMPQIKAEHRGAMVNFLNARGISHETDAEIPAANLKPTQTEFSPGKVAQAKAYEGGDRSILVSSDNYVLDGHHQWLAKLESGEPVKAIRLNAPMRDLLPVVREFPSAETAKGASIQPSTVEAMTANEQTEPAATPVEATPAQAAPTGVAAPAGAGEAPARPAVAGPAAVQANGVDHIATISELRAMPMMTREDGAAYRRAFDRWHESVNPYGMGPTLPKNRKPHSASHPDLFRKNKLAEELAQEGYWQMPYEEAKAKFFGLPLAKWEQKRRDMGLSQDNATTTPAPSAYEVVATPEDKGPRARIAKKRAEKAAARSNPDAKVAKDVAPATHAELGAKPEPVTPPVVVESLSKAAKIEGRKPSEMKADLLAQIDKARTTLPPGIEGDVRDVYLAKQRKVIAESSRKSQAIAAQVSMDAAVADYGHTTFDVPGDGKFKVLNTPDSFADFRRKVESSRGFEDKPYSGPRVQRAPASAGTADAVSNMIGDGDFQAAFAYAEAKGVNLNDIKLSKTDRAKFNQWTNDHKPNGPDKVMFQRSEGKIAGMRRRLTQEVADAISSQWENAPPIVVIGSMAEAPGSALRENEAQLAQGADGSPAAFIVGGKVYLVASQMKTTKDVATALFHEVLGHHGLRGVFGTKLDNVLNAVAEARPEALQEKAKEYGLDIANEEQRLTAAEELLAELAQTKPKDSIVQRAIAAIRTWLRENVPMFKNLALSDAEIIRNFILPARQFVESGQAVVKDSLTTDKARYQRVDDVSINVVAQQIADAIEVDQENDTFAEYALRALPGESDGVQIGDTLAPSSVFDDGNPTGEELPGTSAIRINSPEGFPQINRALADLGVNGKTFHTYNGTRVALVKGESVGSGEDVGEVVIRDAQVVALWNRGDDTFRTIKPNDSDVTKFQRVGTALMEAKERARAVQLPAGYLVGDLFNSAGKVNWWHKTLGTPFNLAKRSPLFKRVYDAVQNFLNDVSYYAIESANLAPRILPKLESWKDIGKSPLTVAETKAIAAPIFEGTLLWTRDAAGKPVKVADLETQAAAMTIHDKAHKLYTTGKLTEGEFKRWRNLPIAAYEGAIENRYEREFLRGGVVWSDSELKSMFGMTDGDKGTIGLYREFRKAIDHSLTNLAISDMLHFGGADVASLRAQALATRSVDEAAVMLRDHLFKLAAEDAERASVLNDTANKMIDKADRAKDLMAKGYAPLSRFGTYSLDVVGADGTREYFGLFETTKERNRMARQMRGMFPGAKVTEGTTSQEAYKLFAGVSPETLELFGGMLGLEAQGNDAASQAFQTYLKLAKSTRSAMKRLIERKGIAGFSEDAGRVLAGFVYSNARQTSSNLHMSEMTQGVRDIPHGHGELQDQASKLVEYVKNPQEGAHRIKALLFAQYLGGSIAAALVNMTQPIAVTFPYLSQYGGVNKARKQMTAAIADAMKKTTGDKALDEALKKAEEEGIVSPQEVHQLLAQSMGRGTLKSGDGTVAGDAAAKASNFLSKLSLGWGKVFGIAEQANRRITFIAAYRTAVDQGMPNPAEFAANAVNETQFTYNQGNRPMAARGAAGSVLMTFKQYSISYLELVNRMWTQGGPEGKKAALLAMAMLFLMGGADGLPFADDADDVIDGAMQHLGYNFSSKQAKREFFANLLGRDGAQFVSKGLSGLPGVPIDVSGRLGMGNVIPGTGMLTKKTDHTSDVAELAGPLGDFGKRVVQATGQAFTGDVGGAVTTIAPKAMQNLVKGYDMANSGMYKDEKGRKVIDVDGFDALSKAIGFQPNDVARTQEAARTAQQFIALNKMRETEIADKWAQGMFEHDPAKVQEARDDLKSWNERNPESRIVINSAQIRRRVQQMGMSKAERLAKTAPKEIRATVKAELESSR